MRASLKAAAFAATLAALPLAGAGTAQAALGISLNFGNVAIGYTDGYYDSGHHWHRWAHPGDYAHYRDTHRNSFHAWRHDDPRHR